MKRRLPAILLALVLLFGSATSVLAQDYYFRLDKMVVDVYWNADGTQSLDYLLTFNNEPSGHPIEFVDVGMPTNTFDYDSIQASINGNPLAVTSDFEGPGGYGFAVEMGQYSIPPGSNGTIRVYVGRVTNVLYEDDDDPEYASAVFAPLYYQSSVITGSTDIKVTYHLPPGIQPEEPRWHAAPSGFPSEPQTGFDADGRITYTWENPNASADTSHLFGASFPKQYIPAESIVTAPPPAAAPSISGDILFNLLCFGFFGFMFFGIPILTAVGNSRRKLQYLPPRIAIEGHGIKRGLTAVEAAILMGEPLDKVMTMILFGTVKKGAATVVTREPLKLEAAKPLPDGLNEYEKQFLTAFEYEVPRERRKALENMVVALVKSVSEKMKGFSRRETIDYYKNIMLKAWQQVEQADTPEVQGQLFDKNLEWTMLDRDYDDRTRRVFRGPIFVPTWWGRYDPTYTRPASSIPASLGRSTSQPSMPSVPSLPGADFASSMVSGVQTFSQKVIGNVTDFTSRVTNVTNPPPPPPKNTGGRSGGGGGRSCACACACAGCACACAGGGR